MGVIRAAVLFCLLLTVPAPARAGAWPQEKGHWFASAAVQLIWPKRLEHRVSTAPVSRYDMAYLEYGLTERWTLGGDIGRSVSGRDKTVIFLRHPIFPREQGPKLAAELGFGKIDGLWVLRPGVSLGMGWSRGWLAADALAEVPLGGAALDTKLDVTFGLNLAEDRKLLVQLQSGKHRRDEAFLRIAPSYVRPLTDRISAEFGATYGIVGDRGMGLKAGVWAKF
ncbi:hypothetical protein [Litorisediminicola beolgyonensis]|uniref:Copper resistance protein B n=1 Tax=Litorisediminicola beolgyonensis TaxID=1173614 RepID=A0ABW3ZN83_9RHOB